MRQKEVNSGFSKLEAISKYADIKLSQGNFIDKVAIYFSEKREFSEKVVEWKLFHSLPVLYRFSHI